MTLPAWLPRAAAWLGKRLPDRWDATTGAGGLTVAAGVALIYRPAGVILFGLELVTVGLLGAAHSGKEQR